MDVEIQQLQLVKGNSDGGNDITQGTIGAFWPYEHIRPDGIKAPLKPSVKDKRNESESRLQRYGF